MGVQSRYGAAVRVPPGSLTDKPLRAAFGPGALLAVIQQLKHPSRRELITATGLARATVESRVERLLAHHWVTERDSEATTGRPPRELVFNQAGAFVLCLDVGARRTRVGIADLGCTMLAESTVDVAITAGPGRVLGEAATALRQLLQQHDIPPHLVLGVGVGVPSPVEVSGQMARPPASGVSTLTSAWERMNIAHEILAFLPAMGIPDVQVAVDKDANLMALGEWRTSWPGVQDLIVIRTGMAISCGIIANGRVLRGSAGVAGDLEHIPDRDSPIPCHCGQRGCLAATASGEAIKRDLGPAAGRQIEQSRDIVDLLRAGDPQARRLTREAGTRIGTTLATAMSILNPDLVVLGGGLTSDAELVQQIRSAAFSNVQPLTRISARIITSGIQQDAVLVGAAHLVLELVTDAPAVDAAIDAGITLLPVAPGPAPHRTPDPGTSRSSTSSADGGATPGTRWPESRRPG